MSGDAQATSRCLANHGFENPRHHVVKPSIAGDSVVPDLLSGPEVQKIFGRSGRTLRRWEQQGYLLPVRVGQAKFFRAEDIQRLTQVSSKRPRHGGPSLQIKRKQAAPAAEPLCGKPSK